MGNAERDELIGIARRNLEQVIGRAEVMRRDVLLALEAVEHASGMEVWILCPAAFEMNAMLRGLRLIHDSLRTPSETAAEERA